MTDETPRALSWVNEQQLAARIMREQPSFAELIHGSPAATRTINSMLETILIQRGQHVRRS